MLLVELITINQGNLPILKDVSLEVERGSALIVSGKTGAGKSTLLRCIAGLHPISGGAISWDGKPWSRPDLDSTPPSKREVGMAFQDHALWPQLTVAQHIQLTIRSALKRNRPVWISEEEIYESLQLKDFLRSKPSALSGGQQQRLSIGRAIASQADLIILDEPLSSQDRSTGEFIVTYLNKVITDHNKACIVVSHTIDNFTGIADQRKNLVL